MHQLAGLPMSVRLMGTSRNGTADDVGSLILIYLIDNDDGGGDDDDDDDDNKVIKSFVYRLTRV